MALRTIELPAVDLAPYDAAQIRFAVEAWPLRAAEELRSAMIFRALREAARETRLSAPWAERFASAARDEVGHARLCADVGARLGARRPAYDPAAVKARLVRLPEPRLRLASLLLVEVAMGETISTSFFRAGRRAAVEPLTRAALTRIAGDEARHQRLGWTAMTAVWPLLSGPQRLALQTEAASGLRALEQQSAVPALDWLRRGAPFDAAYAALGVLAPESRVEAFYAAVEKLVLPRLDRVGLDGKAAWADRYKVPPELPLRAPSPSP